MGERRWYNRDDSLRQPWCGRAVLLRARQTPSETLAAALTEHVRRELGPIATPSAIEFMTALPKTRSGRIMRRYLKAKEIGQEIGDISTLEQ